MFSYEDIFGHMPDPNSIGHNSHYTYCAALSLTTLPMKVFVNNWRWAKRKPVNKEVSCYSSSEIIKFYHIYPDFTVPIETFGQQLSRLNGDWG